MSTRAQEQAAYDASDSTNTWSKAVPLGKEWIPLPLEETSVAPKKPRKNAKKSKKAADKDKPAEEFKGDRALANSIALMRDAMIAREAAFAVAEGDVGRVWEVLKVRNTIYI
jgi:hypothetical protein